MQGVDYAYTINGWLKGINMPSLNPDHDPGGDGAETQAPYSDTYTDTIPRMGYVSSRTLGAKQYELTDHLGNVRATVSDVVIKHYSNLDAELSTRTDYYPFGMIMGGRNSSVGGGHRYGFQSQEKIDEIYGEGNYIDYTYRGYNPRVGRFFAVDPLAARYPYYSSYQFSGNRVIDMIELEGLEPTESGSYSGQGAIAPELDENCDAVEGTENHRWTWKNDAWNASKIGVTQNELTSLFPKGNGGLLKTIETTLNLESSTYGIASQTELNAFIAQTGFETAMFSKLTENLNYSLAGLRANFKRLDKYSDEYLNEMRTDANQLSVLLYGGSGNGIDYRGRGLIHTTWEANYKKASDSYNKMYGTNYDFTKTPALLTTDYQIAVRSALIFFKTNSLFGMSNFDIDYVSKKINFYDKKSFTKRSALFDKVNSVIK